MSTKIKRYVPNADELGVDMIDYIRGLPIRLQTENVVVKGEIQRVNYYASAKQNEDGTLEFSDLVVREDIEYSRDALGFALSRKMVISWYDEDDKVSVQKTREKFYGPMESIREGQKRRSNIVDMTMMSVAGLLLKTGQDLELGRKFAFDHGTAIHAFIDVGKDTLIAETVGDMSPWLDTVISPPATNIRDFIIAEITLD